MRLYKKTFTLFKTTFPGKILRLYGCLRKKTFSHFKGCLRKKKPLPSCRQNFSWPYRLYTYRCEHYARIQTTVTTIFTAKYSFFRIIEKLRSCTERKVPPTFVFREKTIVEINKNIMRVKHKKSTDQKNLRKRNAPTKG